VVRVACPVCGEGIETDLIPDRLPITVPEHRAPHGGTCLGTGKTTRDAWMIRRPPSAMPKL
jgi:hypothetical protein